jgi:hypothetical protein
LDANGNEITDYSWVQTHNVDNKDELVYNGVKDSDNKVIAISSIMGLGTSTQYTTTVRFDKGSMVAQLIDIQSLQVSDEVTARAVRLGNPIIYKKGQDAKIYFHTKTGATGQKDYIMLVGIVAEPRGTYTNE